METATTQEQEARCLRCRRVLTSARSIADGIGKGCAAKIRQAAREYALDGLTDKQAGEAREIAADGGVVEAREGVFRVVSGDGSQSYITTPDGHCTCAWGLRRTMADTKVCKHVGAVRLVQVTPRRSLAKAA
jgi:hypothetical protein